MLTINITFMVNLSFTLFVIGLAGIILNRKNFLVVLMSIEILLLSVNLNFIVFSVYLDDMIGQLFVIFILSIAAIESAVGLSLMIVLYKLQNSIELIMTKKI